MRLLNAIETSIKKHGCSAVISTDGATVKAKAFIEPLRYRNKIYIGGEYRDLGFMRREKYLYIGAADNALKENRSVIESNGNKYIVKRCETYYVKDRPIYVWAILTQYGKALEDDYDADPIAD